MAWNYFFRTTSIQYINLVLKAARSVSTVCKYIANTNTKHGTILFVFFMVQLSASFSMISQ